jgi:hypothetical protein
MNRHKIFSKILNWIDNQQQGVVNLSTNNFIRPINNEVFNLKISGAKKASYNVFFFHFEIEIALEIVYHKCQTEPGLKYQFAS